MARLVILRLLDSYFRRRWLNLLPFVLMLALAGVSFVLAEPQYISHGTIYVQRTSLLSSLTQIRDDAFSWSSPTQIAMNELNELLQTEAFMRSVIQKTDLEANMSSGPDAVSTTIDLVRKALSVQMVGDNLIQISVKNKNPQLAQQLAAATIDAYSLWKLNSDRQESVVAQSFFAAVIPPYQKDLQQARAAMQSYLEDHPVPLRGERVPEEQLQIAQLQAAIDLASRRLESALEKEENARLAQSQAESSVRQNYLVIDAPTLPLKPETSLKERALAAVIFVVLGIMLTVGGIVGGALLDRSFRFPIDVLNSLELPVLAIIPDVSGSAQPPVLNEPTQTLSHLQVRKSHANGFLTLPRRQRKARQRPTLTDQAAGNSSKLAEAAPHITPDQTIA
jgi:uncharacterized protein involved in exopolysaccharide biosynthesis